MNEYQSRYIDLLQGDGPPLSDEQKQEVYNRFFQEARNNPQAARELDIRVMSAAYEQGISSDVATRILVQGPYVQSQLSQNKPIGSLMADHLTPLSTAYVRRETADAIAAIRSERQSAVEQTTTPQVAQVLSIPKAAYQTSAVFLGAGYNVLRVAEQSLFAVTPLPLQQLKSGIQQVGVPLGVAAVAAKVPGLDQLINGAVHVGGDLLSNGASAAAGNTLTSLGQQIQAGLPNGFGIQSVSGALGSAISPVVTNLAERSGQFFGETLTAAGIGKFVLNGAQAVFSQVLEKGPMRTVEDAIVGAQGAIERTKSFLSAAQTKITTFIQGVQAMSQNRISEQYNDPTLRSQLLSGSVGVSESEASNYKRRLDSSIKAVELVADNNASYQVVGGEYLVPKEGLRFNPMNFDAFQALYDFPEDFTPDKYPTAQDFKLAAPAKVSLGEDGKYQLVQKGQFVSPELAVQQSTEPEQVSQPEPEFTPVVPGQSALDDYYSPEPIAETTLNGNGSMPELPSEANEATYTPPLPAEAADEAVFTPIEAEQGDSEALKFSQPEPEAQPKPNAKAAAEAKPPIQKENEDYALSVQNMLSQRGIETQRFQIDVNGDRAFKMENALVTENKLDAKSVEAIKTALNDPANLNGEVRITQGSKVLLHVKDGQVINDPLGITKPSAKVEVNSPSQSLYSEASKDVPGTGLQRTQAIAANAFNSGADREQVMDMIKTHDPEFGKQVQECGSEKAAMMAIGAAVQAAETKTAVAQQSQPAQTKEPAMQR